MVALVQMKYDKLASMMDERLKRHWAACEALALGYGSLLKKWWPARSLASTKENGLGNRMSSGAFGGRCGGGSADDLREWQDL
jgi:hypothetical protein